MFTRIAFSIFLAMSFCPKQSTSKLLNNNPQQSNHLASPRRENLLPISPVSAMAKAFDTSKAAIQYKPDIQSRLITGWGVFTVVAIIGNAIKRVLPIAIQPFIQNNLSPIQWGAYAAFAIVMAYAEGYKAFQLKFAPLVVRRAIDLNDRRTFLNVLLAGFYSMGLFGANRKRMIVSWSLSAGIFGVILLVKKLPYPWRSIVDGGVVVGLTYGTLSICWNYVRSFAGIVPDIDPCHDEKPGAKIE